MGLGGLTGLKCISSDDCVEDQDGEEDDSLDEPDERVFETDCALLLNKALFSCNLLVAVPHHVTTGVTADEPASERHQSLSVNSFLTQRQ